ncbi:MAG: nicotianamine synthase family protein [Tepidanaerobacteraceae bacterium]|jgi:D-arabinose 1-dehydrogenase-like Zn-dependent alcohol dehydrogenase
MIAACTKCIERNFSKSKFLIKLYGIYYKNIVKNEVKLAGIKNSDKVLCIGGGPIPSTAIEVANLTDAQVHVIDMDGNAVQCARNLVKRLGLHHKIVVDQGRGEEVDITPYNVIHVALQVTPKEDVLEHIWSNSKVGDRIIVRMPKKGLRPFYSNVRDSFLKKNSNFIKSCSAIFNPNTMDKTLLMVKG